MSEASELKENASRRAQVRNNILTGLGSLGLITTLILTGRAIAVDSPEEAYFNEFAVSYDCLDGTRYDSIYVKKIIFNAGRLTVLPTTFKKEFLGINLNEGPEKLEFVATDPFLHDAEIIAANHETAEFLAERPNCPEVKTKD